MTNKDEAEIIGIQFGVWSADEIRRLATIDLTDHGTKGNSNAFYDGRFGSIGIRQACFDCRGNTDTCTGHWGMIELPCAVPNPFFHKEIKQILQCFCKECSSLLYTKERIELNNMHKIPGPERIKTVCEILAKSKGTFQCPNENCNTPVNEVAVKDDKTFIYKYSLKGEKSEVKKGVDISYNEIYEMFKNIKNEDLEILGFNQNLIQDPKYVDKSTFINGMMVHRHQNRPEDYFVTVLPVLPVCIRSYTCQGKKMTHDDATILYQLILKDVNVYKKAKKDDDMKKAADSIQRNIFSLFKQKGEAKGIKKPYNSIHNRLSGKDGHFRGAVESKRANYGARSVTGNAPYLPFGMIEIPQEITKVTQTTAICSFNLKHWNNILIKDRQMMKIAHRNYSNSKTKKSGNFEINTKSYTCYDQNTTDFSFIKYEPVIQYIIRKEKQYNPLFVKELKIGDCVHRRLTDGDYIIGNRQPTIRKESFNSYKVHISRDPTKRTICLTLPACTGLNMDFDGDEANLHVPQGPKCVAEMIGQMNIENKIMTCQTSSNIVDLVQGVVYGLYILTQNDTFVTREDFYLLCMSMTASTKEEAEYLRPFDMKEFSTRLRLAGKPFSKLVKKGKIISAYIPGKVVFSMLLPRYYNSEISTKYKDDVLIEGVVIKNGVLIDGVLTKKTMNRIIQELYINFSKKDSIHYINGANFLCNTWNLMHGFTFGLDDCLNTKEAEVQQALKEAEEEVTYINSMPKTKEEKEILIKEALGMATQVAQKISKDGMVGGEKNAMAISTISKAKGSYVNLCYISCFLGLQTVLGNRYEPELCEGRRTLPCFKRNDMTPKSRGFIESNLYGGLDPAGLFFHGWSARKGLVDTAVTTRTSGYSHRQFGKKMENARVDQYGTIRDCDGSIIDFCYGEYGFDAAEVFWTKGKPFFIDFKQVADAITSEWKDANPKVDCELFEFTEKHLNILNGHLIIYGESVNNEPIIATKKRIQQLVKNNMKGVKLYANKHCLNAFFDKVRIAFYRSRAPPGCMVGFKATCSIGEAGTQAVLDAFHQSGTSSKTTTIGLPRLEELTNLTKLENLKATGGSFEYNDNILKNGTKAEKLKRINELRSEFEYKTLLDFAKEITIEKLTENEPTNEWEVLMNIHKAHQKPEWLDTWVEVNGYDYPNLDEGFVIKCEIDKNRLYKYGKTLHDLVNSLNVDKFFAVPSPPSLCIIYIYPNYEDVLLPKTIDGGLDNWRYYYTRDVCIELINSTHICGIPGIQEIYYSENNTIDFQGNNFIKLMKNENIIFSTLETDVIWDVYENLGINAAYIFLYEELSKCTSKTLNPSHFMLLARTMTNEGFLTNVTRNGISEKVGVLTKASFEMPVDNCLSAAIWGKNDGVDSLASSYFLGTVGKYGTRNPNFTICDKK